jgi:poly(3-hydroxybutyrate) depolymerase
MAYKFLAALILPALVAGSDHHNTDCDVSPGALTEQFGVHIPQTCIQVGKRKRCYYTYIPECASDDAAVVYDIHGYGECPRSFSAYSGWFQKATDECFVVVWPTVS